MPSANLCGDLRLGQPVDAIARSRSKAASPRRPAPRALAAPASPRISTSPRLMPKRSSSACIANCGWFDAGGVVNLPCASLMPPIDCHASSSRSVSSPGSTTAPCGRRATACRNFAVAGIEPVEPAAITGPS